MNATRPGRGDAADLARLLPAPAERDLPAHRGQAVRDHLMSELRTASHRTAEKATPRRRVGPLALIVTAAAAVAVAVTLSLLPSGPVSRPAASQPTAARLLARIAAAAARQPIPAVRDNQFWYIQSWVAYDVCIGGSGSDCTLEKPHERQIWQSVSNACVTGLLREYGQDTPIVFSSNYLHCPYPGGQGDITYRYLQSLPSNPRVLLNLIEQQMLGQLPQPENAFRTIGDMLREAIAPPRISAALYRAAALIPGVTVVGDATDAIGRHGVAVAYTYLNVRTEWIFSKTTLLYLGEREINVPSGTTAGEAAVLRRAFVDHAGQLPG
jgi:hypothetical protein